MPANSNKLPGKYCVYVSPSIVDGNGFLLFTDFIISSRISFLGKSISNIPNAPEKSP